MRLIGDFKDKKLAQRFIDYLNGQGLDSQLRQHDQHYEAWVLDDAHLDAAKQLYTDFLAAPTDSKFKTGYRDRVQRQRERDRALKKHYRHYFKRPSGNQLTISLVLICVAIYLLSLTTLRNAIFYNLMISLPGYSVTSVWASQPWRLLTPMLLHFSIWHILFNMFWLYDLGSLIEKKEGKLFYVVLIVVASLVSGLLQFAIEGPRFGGMSGVVYALFAYIWISSKYNLRSGYYMSNQIVLWMVGWFVLCFTGYLGPVANYGHLGGLVAGALVAWLRKFRDEHA